MKKLIFVILLIAILPYSAACTDALPDAGQIEQSLPTESLERLQQTAPDFSFTELVDGLMQGDFTVDFLGIIKKILSMLFSEVAKNVGVCGAVLLLSVICSMLSGMQSSFARVGTTDAAFFCCFTLAAGLLTAGFSSSVEMAQGAIEDMIVAVQTMVPVLTSMSIATGSVVSAPLLHTVILLAASLCSMIVKSFLLPLTYAVFALQLVNSLTARPGLRRLSEFLRKISRWTLGLMLTLFTSGIAITGFAAGSAEGLGGRAARYAISSLIPVAGAALSDTVSALASSAAMIRNATGLAGIILIAAFVAYPIIKAAALTVTYNMLGAVLEPVADERFARAVGGFSDCMAMLFGQMAVVAVMIIISVSILLTASGIGG